MKKIFTILCLMALTMGAQAQVHVTQTGQNMLTATQIMSKADAGDLYVALQLHTTSSNRYFNKTGCVSDVFDANGTTTWKVIPHSNGGYVLQNCDGNYINNTARPMTVGDDINSATRFEPVTANAGVGDIASGYNSSQAVRWAVLPNKTVWFIANGATDLQTVLFGGGTGCWSVWFTYEVAIKYNIVYKCYLEGESEPFQTVTSTDAYADGETVTVTDAMVPEFTGKTMTSHDASVTINGANAEVSVYYSEATTRNITYQVVDGNSSVLFTSEPVTVNDGTTISTLPAEYQKTLFYDYNGGGTVTEDNQVITFTATLKDSAPFIFTADATSPVWYNLLLHPNDKHYPTYVAEGTPNVTLPNTFTDDETTQWAFIGNPYDGFKIINNAAGTSLVLGSEAAGNNDNNGGNTYATLNSAGTKTYETWTITASTHATNGFFIANEQDYKLNYRSTANLAYWTGGFGAGSTFVATKVPEPEERYQQLIALLETYPYGTGLGQYSLSLNSEDKTAQAGSLISDLKAAEYTAENYTQAQAIQAGTSLNMPKANTFLRIKSVVGDKAYLKAADAGATMTFSTTADASTIFCYIDNKLVAYQNGLAVNNINQMGTAGGAATTFTFKEGLNGAMSTYSLYGGENAVLYSKGTNGSNADWFNTGNQRDNTTFTLEEVTTLPVKMNVVGDKSYATFYSPVAISQVDGAKVYVVNETKSKSVVIEEATTQAIPAGKGVMLVSDDKNTSATLTIGEAEDFNTGLNGVTASVRITKDSDPYNSNLFLSKKDGKIGFYKIKTTENVGVTGGFKAYLSTAAGAKEGFELEFGGVTGIENMEHGTLNMENGAVYNLQGQRVNKAQKGVFIQNGKKVVVR